VILTTTMTFRKQSSGAEDM